MKQALLSSTSLVSQGLQGSLTPFNYSGGIVQFVVPASGTYDIAAFGAQGGSGVGNAGGEGGKAEGVFTLTAGETLEIAVGGAGANGSSPKGAGGGGGGSFVILNNNGAKSVLEVGGGGGGGSGVNAYGGAGQAGGTANGGNGSGGGGNHTLYGGGGGGGYKGNGTTAGGFGSPSATDGTGGKDYANGLLGGAGAAGAKSLGAGGVGGFGGGGGGGGGGGSYGQTFFGNGGGGGGYSGGYAGGGAAPHVALGGTSFLGAGATQTTFASGVQIGNGYVSVTELPCFAAGTQILTDRGLVAVEQLRIGMRARTNQGRAREIVWIGYRTVDCLAHPEPAKINPVRVRAGAFGSGVPARDVRLSPDHAVFVDGVLIPVRCLIDGETIRQEAANTITYFHVELAEHEVIFAEGLPVELFLDTGNRANFANGGTLARLAPDFITNAVAWQWETGACAPLIITGRKLEIVRARLREIADQCLKCPPAKQFAA